MAVDLYNIGIQMNRTKLTKTFILISNNKTFDLHVFLQ